LAVGLWAVTALSAQAQWHYYYYFKEPQPLVLDVSRVAVFAPEGGTTASIAKALPAQRVSIRDVRASVIPRMSIAHVSDSMRSEENVSAIIESLPESSDVAFVSPVFLDARGEPTIITQHLHVGFYENVDPQQAEAVLTTMGAGVIEQRDWSRMKGVYRIASGLRNGFDVLELANRLAQLPEVTFAEPDMIVRVRKELYPNDPLFPQVWGLHNTGQQGGVADMDMDAPEAWDATVGDPDVIVVIMDEGAQQNHPDLNQVPGADFTGHGTGGGPYNVCDNHGTGVAGCVSAIINNSLGTVGIAPGAKIASAKWGVANIGCWGGPLEEEDCTEDADCYACVGGSNQGNSCTGAADCPGGTCDMSGTCSLCLPTFSASNSWLVNSLDWAQTIGAKATNSSFSSGESSAVTSKFASTRAAGIVHFAAAGNYASSTISYPARLPTVNAVAALERHGLLASFSNWGVGLDFSAPGVDMWSTDRTGSEGYDSGDYTLFGGTSAASPYAAGVAALAFSMDFSLTPDDIEQAMKESCMDLGAAGYDTTYGWGFVNGYQVVRSVAGPVLPCEFANLTAYDGAAGDNFGNSVSISGDVAVVGARNNGGVGAAYVYRWDGTSCNEEAKLTAFDAEAGDNFGFSVSVDGDVIVVGARTDDHSTLSDAGSAYVFRWDSSWNFEQKLTASDAASNDRFGYSVSVSGDAIIVGAYAHDAVGPDSGAAYTYRWDTASWGDEQKLVPSDAASGDNFGFSVSVSGDWVIVGSTGDDDAGTSSGSVYVYQWDGNAWGGEQKLTASDATGADLFGTSVSIGGDYAAVGARGDDDKGANSGSAYVFNRSGSTWTEQQKVTSSYVGAGDDFGYAVAINEKLLVVGALNDDVTKPDAGSVYVFARQGSSWSRRTKLVVPDSAEDDQLGTSVAVSGNFVVAGVPGDDPGGNGDAGAAYLYVVSDDCNHNGFDDACDIRDGTSLDENHDGVPDECVCPPPNAPVAEAPVTPKVRYLSFVPGNAGEQTALRLTLVNMPPPFQSFNGTQMWVDAPTDISEVSGKSDATPPVFSGSRLTCDPVYLDWGAFDEVHVFDRGIVPGAEYAVQSLTAGCDVENETHYSAALTATTSRWGDLVGDCSVTPCTPPNTVVNFDDIASVVDKFKNLGGAPTKPRADLAPDLPDRIVDFVDIPSAVDAFRGRPYPYGGPTGCP
jgi:hypothetical protein